MRDLLAGASVKAVIRGNRRLLAAIKARGAVAEPDPCEHPDHKKPTHAQHCASHPTPKAPADDEHPFVTWAKRVGGAVGVLFLLWPLVGKWLPTVAAGTVTLWVLAALIAGQERPAEAPSGTAQPADASLPTTTSQDDDAEEFIQADPSPDVLWALVRHTAGLTKQGTAAHLSAVLEEGQRRGQFGGWRTPDLADLLASLGVPVVEGKKLTVGGRDRNRQAVLLAALPQADPAPVPAVASSAA
jgi:hypothetical protein